MFSKLISLFSKYRKNDSHRYISKENNKYSLKDDIYIDKMDIDNIRNEVSSLLDSDFIKEITDDVEYSWKKVYVNPVLFNSILDKEGYFTIDESFLIKLEHGNGFSKGAIHVGSSYGFTATICIKNDGISGICVPNSVYLKTHVEEGDYIISRSSRGIKFLPHIGHHIIYLVLSIVPTKKLSKKGFVVPVIASTQTSSSTSYIVSNRYLKIIDLINTVIHKRDLLEKYYIAAYMTNELLSVYDSHILKHNNISVVKNVTFSDDDIYKKSINNDSRYDAEKSIRKRIINKVNDKNLLIKNLWNEISNLYSRIEVLLDDDDESLKLIDSYVIYKLSMGESYSLKEEIVNNLFALSNIGFRIQ
ncbi:SPV023 hypothetical protein [Swinepox virus]|uniref:Uncharacterized protein n=1 Tax=Swinepox virus (strain Swine/Nebraska/17077-99/1999) TaxID=300880 RepID=Q8V3S0_SWPV1|nr:Hypothetical protein SWPVgp023 [Swinepox virus]AAL69762.1 SPV023 hypothetical protein [Swinepox virus]UED36579.1 hypothetical protein SPVwb_022 [Swinepox virus]UED36728.1 hypothetical protein SPVdp_024 [Swinepox virus]UUA44213.1 SPV023 [Swinepox virus]